MKNNVGYGYAGLPSYKIFTYFFVPLCYRCYKINHFAGECPDKDMPATCDKGAGRHKNNDCNRNSLEKCVNYVQKRVRNFKHNASSRERPTMVKARAFVIRKIYLDGKKNKNSYSFLMIIL